MYTPVDSPYVSHADGLAIHTAYIEKVRAYRTLFLGSMCAVCAVALAEPNAPPSVLGQLCLDVRLPCP